MGELGQKNITDARVLVVGMGGLGCPVTQYLVAAGVGTLGLVDGDKVEEKNLHRQILYTEYDINQYKVEVAATRLSSLNPTTQINKYTAHLNAFNAKIIIEKYDYVIDCTDNFEAKYLLNDLSILMGKTFISASASGFEGNLMVININKNVENPCLRCLFPNDRLVPGIGDCNQSGILGAFVGIIGSWQAAEILKIILTKNLSNSDEIFVPTKALFFDFHDSRLRSVVVRKNSQCACSDKDRLAKNVLIESLYVTRDQLDNLLNLVLVDIRSQEETEKGPVNGFESNENFLTKTYTTIMSDEDSSAFWQTDKTYVLCCASGVRSAAAARRLRDQGHQVFSLKFN